MKNIFREIRGKNGYFDKMSLDAKDLENFHGVIYKNIINNISSLSEKAGIDFAKYPISKYHEFLTSHPELVHEKMWPKKNRLLKPDDVDLIRNSSFFRELIREFPGILISNEEGIYPEEVYWRICRPIQYGGLCDVGPMHADQWFWALGHGREMSGFQRVKIWVSIFNEMGMSGFRYVSGSHNHSFPYIGVMKDGFIKPAIQVLEGDLDIEVFLSRPGDIIAFHDKLLHGGMVGGNLTRVSLEFTILVPDQIYYKNT
ncbi:hypothetical protein [Polynucleobacter sp. MWH-UH23A]|uniref:hypothetical protein n=1 Tax=Polynucleobacter sp. MWH-UH23A TaxID=1855613 RepID=UPI003364D801